MRGARKLVVLSLILSISGLLVYGYWGRVEHSRKLSPDSKYYAVVSYRPFAATDSDAPCFVKIEDKAGRNFGEVPASSIQVSGVSWDGETALMNSRAEWNFKEETCSYVYWNDGREEWEKVTVR